MSPREVRTRVFRGGTAHNAVSVPHLGSRTSNAPLRWTSKGIDPVGEHALLCTQGVEDYLYEAGVDLDQLCVCGAHANSALAAVNFAIDVTEFENPALNRIKYEMGAGERAATLNAGRATFHLRVGRLHSYRLHRAVIDQILSGGAHEVDFQDHAVNRVFTHVMRLLNGNPFAVTTDGGVSRQAALMFLYVGHVVDSM